MTIEESAEKFAKAMEAAVVACLADAAEARGEAGLPEGLVQAIASDFAGEASALFFAQIEAVRVSIQEYVAKHQEYSGLV